MGVRVWAVVIDLVSIPVPNVTSVLREIRLRFSYRRPPPISVLLRPSGPRGQRGGDRGRRLPAQQPEVSGHFIKNELRGAQATEQVRLARLTFPHSFWNVYPRVTRKEKKRRVPEDEDEQAIEKLESAPRDWNGGAKVRGDGNIRIFRSNCRMHDLG